MILDEYVFSPAGRKECLKIGLYFSQIFSITPAQVSCDFYGNEYVVKITEKGILVNKYIASPSIDGKIGTIRISGMNQDLIYTRYQREHKVLWFNAYKCDRDPWGEYLEFTIS